MREKSLLIIKPDGVARGLTEEILNRVEQTGLAIVRQSRLQLTTERAADLYAPHLGQKFYPGLIEFITSGPIMVCQVEGADAITRLRALLGATDPLKAELGSIRGDLKEDNTRTAAGTIKNLVHGSDGPESASRELNIFFGEEA